MNIGDRSIGLKSLLLTLRFALICGHEIPSYSLGYPELLRGLGIMGSPPHRPRLFSRPTWHIMPSMTPEQKAAYVAGFIDGEGHIGCHPTGRGHWTRCVSFCNTDPILVRTVCAFLTDLGIPTRSHFSVATKKGWADRWTVYVNGSQDNYKLFRDIIPIQSPGKIAALNKIIEDSYADMAAVNAKRRIRVDCTCEVCKTTFHTSPALFLKFGVALAFAQSNVAVCFNASGSKRPAKPAVRDL